MFFILTMSRAFHPAQTTIRSRGRMADMTSQGGWVKRLWRYYDRVLAHGRQAMLRIRSKEKAMAREDDDPMPKRHRLEKLLLDTMGIEELRSYIDELKAEIVRVEADIGRKSSHRSAADAFFKRP
jgi:uncharacterized small protein (DUF1192 family)